MHRLHLKSPSLLCSLKYTKHVDLRQTTNFFHLLADLLRPFFMHNSRILVTGGSGILGSAIINRLAQNGVRVAVFDKKPYEGPGQIEYFCQGDITNKQSIIEATKNVDGIIHCAGVRDLTAFPDPYMKKVILTVFEHMLLPPSGIFPKSSVPSGDLKITVTSDFFF